MKFKKYPSVDNSYRKKTISYIKKFGFNNYEWVVTNKIHGANFSIWYDGKELKCAKRTGFIDEKDNFYNYKKIIKNYNDKVKLIYKEYKDLYNNDIVLVLFGEIFGGTYNHPDVVFPGNATKVQKGVYYCPHNEFYLFDIMINERFISFDDVIKIGEKYGFIYSKPLFRGSFEDCLKFNPVFEDPTYKEFDLPKIEDNISEGIVLKPVITSFFPNGSRCILKNKNPKFIEKTKKKKKVKKEIPEHLKEKIESVSQYVTKNRLRNVISHGHKIGQKDFGKLMKLFVTDIIDEYEKDNDSLYKGIKDKKEKNIINKSLNKMCSDLIRQHFINIIDGEF